MQRPGFRVVPDSICWVAPAIGRVARRGRRTQAEWSAGSMTSRILTMTMTMMVITMISTTAVERTKTTTAVTTATAATSVAGRPIFERSRWSY